jgi:hypothetical protein
VTLTEFLLDRIAEDEAVVVGVPDPLDEELWRLEANRFDWPQVSPARVLAECEARLRIVDLHRDGGQSQGFFDAGYETIDHACWTCGSHGEYGVQWPCATVKALALPYATHPDYPLITEPA